MIIKRLHTNLQTRHHHHRLCALAAKSAAACPRTPPTASWQSHRRCCALNKTPSSSSSSMAAEQSQSYSLWLKPAAGTHLSNKLAQEVASQAKEFGGPLFEPHVTLLGGIKSSNQDSVIATAQQLASKLQKFRLNFLDVSHGTTYHRCIYILVAKEAAIMHAGQLAQQEFGMEGDYMPHLSLLYASLGPEAMAQAQQAAVQRLYGEGSTYSSLLTDAGFTAEAITVWYTPEEDRSLGSWKQVAELPLRD